MPQVKSDSEGRYGGSMLRCIMQMVSKGGVGALFKGLVPSLWLVSNPVVQYFTYERLRIAAVLFRGSLQALDIFVIGALAKMAATVVTFPLQIAQVQVYNGARKESRRDKQAAEARPEPLAPGRWLHHLEPGAGRGQWAGLEGVA